MNVTDSASCGKLLPVFLWMLVLSPTFPENFEVVFIEIVYCFFG